MAANSISSAGGGEWHLGDRVLRGKGDPGHPDGDLHRKDGDHDPDQSGKLRIKAIFSVKAHVCGLFLR